MFHRKAANLKHYTSTTGGEQVHTARMYSSQEWKFSFFSINIARRVIFGKEVTMSDFLCERIREPHRRDLYFFFLNFFINFSIPTQTLLLILFSWEEEGEFILTW